MTCPVPPIWPVIAALFLMLVCYHIATVVLMRQVRTLEAKLRERKALKKAPWTVTLDEFDIYALGRGAHWTFGEGRVQTALRSIAERAQEPTTIEHGIGAVSLPIGEIDPETGKAFTNGIALYFCTCGKRFHSEVERDFHIVWPQRVWGIA